MNANEIRVCMKIKKNGYVPDSNLKVSYWKVLKKQMRNKTWWFYVATAIDGSSHRTWVHENEVEDYIGCGL